MADTKALPDDILAEVARQTRERLVVANDDNVPFFSFKSLRERGEPSTSTLELGETLEVWRLSPAAVGRYEKGGRGLTAVAKRTGSWHHQIRLDKDTIAFARSTPSAKGDRSWSVQEIFVSPLAEAIDRAIMWADEGVLDDKLARLLTAPAYQVEALWFVDKVDARREGKAGDGDVLIVTAPADSARLMPMPFRLMDYDDFLDALRQEPVGMGLGT